MSPEETRYIQAKPILIPVPGMEPAKVDIKVPASDPGPSALQLELLERIRSEFPRLWNELLGELQRDWGESNTILYDPVEAFSWVGVLIEPWEERRNDDERATPVEPSIDNYFWEIGLDHSAIPDCSGCHATFLGLKFLGSTLYW
jgi:hypothetical protein